MVAATFAGLFAALIVLAAGAFAPPLRESCPAGAFAPGICHETILASLERGLPPLHPLILGARAEPGPASGVDTLGQRATVVLDMLGVPDPVRVKLFYDVGAHWGGSSDRSAPELAIWSLAWAVLAGVAVGLAVRAATRLAAEIRRGREPNAGSDPG